MCKKCQQHYMIQFANGIMTKFDADKVEENTADPIYVAAIAAGAAGAGDVDFLALMSVNVPLDQYAAGVKALLMLAGGLEQLGTQMLGAMAHRAILTGEALPEWMEISAGNLSDLPPEVREQLAKSGVKMGGADPRPADDNPELLKAIFANKKNRKDKGGPVS